jgi:hypothetical protein
MTNQKWFGGLLVLAIVGGLWMGGGTEVAGEDSESAGGGFKPVASVHALMEAQEHHFEEIKELLLNESAENRAKNLESEAEILAELANVNFYHKDRRDYQDWAASVRRDAVNLAKAAKAGDNSGMRELYKSINTTCNDCHDKYQ